MTWRAVPKCTKQSCAVTIRLKPAFRNPLTCLSRKCARSASTWICIIPNSSVTARAAARHPKRRSSNQRTDDGRRRDGKGRQTSVGCPLSSVVRDGELNEPRDHDSLQPAGAGSGLRPDPHLDCESGEGSVVVLRRDQEAGNHQLSYV